MDNFTYQNPVKIIFGQGQIAQIAKEISTNARIMVTYGGGSVEKNGTMAEVEAALSGRTLIKFGGIEPNPTYETLMKAVELARKEQVDFLLAVGGGSVIDGTKFIAAAIPFAGEPWDILAKGAKVQNAVPMGTVLTLPATGSEMNTFAVVTKAATQDKLSFASPLVYPKFSVLDPSKTYTLPIRQVSNGVVDAFTHVMEQYLTYPVNAPLQDRFAEGILLTLIEEGPKALKTPEDYAVRANIMWCATMALNGLIAVGVPQDWATHMIGHELTALYGLDHAQTLAIVLPALLNEQRSEKRAKLLHYAKRVWQIDEPNEDKAIDEAIARTRSFFESMGVPTRLSAYTAVPKDYVAPVMVQIQRHGLTALGEHKTITPEVTERILKNCA